jgi:hypothetical protein
MFSYRSILGSAWAITKQHKKLWIFGFLAFLLSAGGEYQILTKILNEDYGAGVYNQMQSESVFLSNSFWSNLTQACYNDPRTGLSLLILLVLLAAVIFALLWVCIKSQMAIVKWSKTYLSSKNKDKKASFWTEISSGDNSTWSVLCLNITLKVIISLLFSLLSLPLIYLYFAESGLAILIYTIFFTIFLPIALSTSLVINYAIAGVVLEKKTFVKSIESAYALFKRNWLVSLEMAVLLFLVNFLIGLVTAFVLSIIILPIILTLIIFNLVLPLYLMTTIAFLLLVITAAVLMVFQTSSWTILFLELKEDTAKAKLERIFTKKNKKTKTKTKK